MVRVRFAPSPTGSLHIGGARTALFNFVFARKMGGQFILRLDDTDRERSLEEHEKGIYEGLRWLGMDWDEGPEAGGPYGPYRQSERMEQHLAAAEKLKQSGGAYVDDEGVLRLRYPKTEVIVDDIVNGECVFKTDALGPEPVLLRSNGTPTYHLASVADDVDMKITHIIRGADHLTNTAKHKLIFEALGAPVPRFAHLPLILGPDGAKLSKRNSECLTSVGEFQASGFLPQALNNFLMLLGWSHPESKEQLSMEDSIESFDLERVGNTAAVFDNNKLNFLNSWWIRHLPVAEAASALEPFTGQFREQIEARGHDFWLEAVDKLRDGCANLRDAEGLAKLLVGDGVEVGSDVRDALASDSEFRAHCRAVAPSWSDRLEETELDADRDTLSPEQAKQLTNAVKKETGLKGKELFKPLRAAVTGSLSGPDLGALLSLTRFTELRRRAKQFVEAAALEN